MEQSRILLIQGVGSFTIDAWLRGVITLDEAKRVYDMWWWRLAFRIRKMEAANARG